MASVSAPAYGCELIRERHRVGRTGALLDVDRLEHAKQLAFMIRDQHASADLWEVIPAGRTVYLQGPPAVLDEVLRNLENQPVSGTGTRAGRTVEITVAYDGVDLPIVASSLDLSVSEVIEIHSGTEYEVAFFGFAPGQAFFGELSPRLRLPRRSTPRTKVPSGALAIANEFSVIYPDNSPGGWHLIGTRVGPPMWDVKHDPPSALDVGDRVLFRRVQ